MRGFFFKKLFLFFICVTFVSTPFLVFSQEVSAPDTTPAETNATEESTENSTENNAEDTEQNTTQDTSSNSENSSSSADQSYFIDNTKPEGERVVEKASNDLINPSYVEQHKKTTTETQSEVSENIPETPEVLGESTNTEPQPQEPKPTPTPVPVEKKPVQEETPLSELTRVYDKKIFVNKEAKHECHAEFFQVDMSEKNSTTNTILFTKEADIPYEMEIGSLPIGIDIRFSESNSYHKNLGSTEESIDISIKKESDAVKGNFTVPIIYTQKGVFDSSVICQINVINL